MFHNWISRLLGAGAVLGFSFSAGEAAKWDNYDALDRTPASCPIYTDYAKGRHAPYSGGTLNLPFMRPSPECRTFNSSAVERVISDMNSRLKDPDLARLFENTFPNTLDTTVKYFDQDENLAFIVTGDITAQWLRDTGNQFAHLYKLLPYDDELRQLVKAVINTEARYIRDYPYCGAFQPPPESGLPPSHNKYADRVTINPPVDNQTVFECKYELDSLAGFLKISRSYAQNTNDTSFVNENWNAAIGQILRVLNEQSQGSWSDDWIWTSYYNFTGRAGSLVPPVPNGGNGEPKLANGLVGSSHRPSDDLVVFQYITADNAMMSYELDQMAWVLDGAEKSRNVTHKMKKYARVIKDAVWNHTLTADGVFAYETNGYGGFYIMDDANVPSLLSLPYLGFLDRDDETYQKTKEVLLSPLNPYYAVGRNFSGIGGPHATAWRPWPMSQISAIFGADNDTEIRERLGLILGSTAGLGLIHESVSIYDPKSFTRPWFAWANSFFAEMLLDLAERKPALIFADDEPYVIGRGWANST